MLFRDPRLYKGILRKELTTGNGPGDNTQIKKQESCWPWTVSFRCTEDIREITAWLHSSQKPQSQISLLCEISSVKHRGLFWDHTRLCVPKWWALWVLLSFSWGQGCHGKGNILSVVHYVTVVFAMNWYAPVVWPQPCLKGGISGQTTDNRTTRLSWSDVSGLHHMHMLHA